jgi:hypothetical protein
VIAVLPSQTTIVVNTTRSFLSRYKSFGILQPVGRLIRKSDGPGQTELIIKIQDAKIVLWTLLTAIYEDELIEEPQGRETIIENIERQKEQLLVSILGPR